MLRFIRIFPKQKCLPISSRFFSDSPFDQPRERVEYDALIVGGGPAGLSAAIRMKQKAAEAGTDLNVCVIEKGFELGAHTLSGNVFEPRALNELFPNWKELGAPLDTPAKEDVFYFLPNDSMRIPTPIPPMLHNDGNYIISLGKLVKWLGEQAEGLGIDIFTGTPASEVLYSDDKSHVVGIATSDVGIGKNGEPTANFSRGMEIVAKQTLFAEGARGSCSMDVMEKFDLRKDADPQVYALGLKEVWRIPKDKHKAGHIQHTLGWPLSMDTYGGSFLYHMGDDLVLLGMAVGLDYKNPYISPYQEFQKLKLHPTIRSHIEGGECIQYGARVINEGGYQAVPKLTFPGGALIGCCAGFLNVPKIKGTHTAMQSAIYAADSIVDLFTQQVMKAGNNATVEEAVPTGLEVTDYQKKYDNSWIKEELKSVRNFHPSFHYGLLPGLAYSGLSSFILKGKEPWTFRTTKPDWELTEPAANHKEIEYPKPDNVLTFDILTNLQRSGTSHEADQPSHLKIKPGMEDVPTEISYKIYAAPESRFCPAKVYEYPEGKLVINAQNCLHCKACSIKPPMNFIKWTVPEAGGGGPAYEIM